jgi:hypothetical protein
MGKKISDYQQEIELLKEEVNRLTKLVDKLSKPTKTKLPIPPYIIKESIKVNEEWHSREYPYEAYDQKRNIMMFSIVENKWIRYARAVYIVEHGIIPKEYSVYQLDGDKNNYNIDNLAAMDIDSWNAMRSQEVY